MSQVYIIGAGVSGLITAIELEAQGYSPIILEQQSTIGGRLQTDWIEGIPVDHGFQVLLTAYPHAKRYLDYNALNLQYFDVGATIYKHRKSKKFGDSKRDSRFFVSNITFPWANFRDKYRIKVLQDRVKQLSIETIFEKTPAISTIEYLKKLGFSKHIITHFFKPFFGGIFLEKALQTPASMFVFVFKMFAEGKAAIPERGIADIPAQLRKQLKRTQIQFQTEVVDIQDKSIKLKNGESLPYSAVVVTNHIPNLNPIQTQMLWNSCVNLYFTVPKDHPILLNRIGLIASDSFINNFHYLSRKEIESRVLSITAIGDYTQYSDEDLKEQANQAFEREVGYTLGECIAIYRVQNALPRLDSFQHTIPNIELDAQNRVFVGDISLYPSLNAAMESGRLAAEAIRKANI